MNKAQKLITLIESYYDERGYKAWMDPKGNLDKFSVRDIHNKHVPRGYKDGYDAMEDGWVRLYVGPNEIDLETAVLGPRGEARIREFLTRAEPTPRKRVAWDKFDPDMGSSTKLYGPEFWGKHFGSRSRVTAFR